MEENDTIRMKVNLSLCMVNHYEEILLIRHNQKNYITGKAQQTFIETEIKTLEQRELKEVADSLTFESFFKYLNQNNIESYSNPFLTIIYKNDTVKFLSSGVSETGAKIEYYSNVMRKIYPENEFYNVVEVKAPPEPMAVPDIN